jgi:hypothetical protein
MNRLSEQRRNHDRTFERRREDRGSRDRVHIWPQFAPRYGILDGGRYAGLPIAHGTGCVLPQLRVCIVGLYCSV